jgi:hypothetical protein
MSPLELSVSDATIWSVTLESSITILEASFTLFYFVYSTGIAYDHRQFKIVICLFYRLQELSDFEIQGVIFK